MRTTRLEAICSESSVNGVRFYNLLSLFRHSKAELAEARFPFDKLRERLNSSNLLRQVLNLLLILFI